MARKRKLGKIIEWRIGPAGEPLPVVMAKVIDRKNHIVEVISPYTGNKNYHGGNPNIEAERTTDPRHYFCRCSVGGYYFFKLPNGGV